MTEITWKDILILVGLLINTIISWLGQRSSASNSLRLEKIDRQINGPGR